MLEQTSGSTGPAIHYLPYPRNPYFSGRQRVLESLHRSLSVKHPERVQIISGDGGVGKTQLALEYAFRRLESYGLVWWLPATDVNTLQSAFAALSEQLGVGGSASSAQELRDAVCRELEKRDDWLLIFDDAPDRESVRAYIPRKNGHILITSRQSNWDGVGKSFTLRVLERPDAIEFLLKRSGRPFEPSAHSLSQALGDLPLALDQAGALIASAEITFADYLRRFEDHWAELLQSGRSAGEYPDAVAMTWELACREVERIDVQVAAILRVLAYLAPSEVPRSFLRRMVPVLPPPLSDHFSSHVVLEGAIERLTQFSLVSGDDRAIVVHRLVASMTRDRLHEDERANWCEIVLSMMQQIFRFRPDDTTSWVECAEALPHALAVSALAETAAIDPATNAKLLNQIGEYLQQAGLLEAAKTIFERALARSDEAHGPEDVRRAAIVNNLGRVLKRMGSVDQAREHFESALHLDREIYGESHPHVAVVANNYGTVLHMAGDVKTALHQFEWALEICRNSYGPEHSKVATITNNIAYALANRGDLDRGLEYFMQALSTAEASCGPNHPLVATIRTNMGIVLRLKGQTDAARVEFERAVAIGQATLGPDHTDVARSLSQLGALAYDQNDFETARDYFQRALNIDQRVLGDNHPLICARLNDLSCCLKALNDVNGATACSKRVAEITQAKKPAIADTGSLLQSHVGRTSQ
jgi:tetratricopeptide (TPR) repeat protein